MDKAMNDAHNGAVGTVVLFLIGTWLEMMNWLPIDLMEKLIVLFVTGGATAVGGLLMRRVVANLLKKAEQRKWLPSIFKDDTK